jgi:Ca2+-binding RTX toxin-like protein
MAKIKGTAGNDNLLGTAGDDTIEGQAGNDALNGLAGNDVVEGGDGEDTLMGESGNDFLEGNKGSDTMIGGAGQDTLEWDDGDGSDLMSGGDGADVIQVDGSLQLGDSFVLGQLGTNAIFDRINLVPFKLTVDTSETFNVNGEGGDDSFQVGDLSSTAVTLVKFSGDDGNDSLDGSQTSTQLVAYGGRGNDALTGGSANDTLEGGAGDDDLEGEKGNDTMIGGKGRDTLGWDDGDGSDRMIGGAGTDTVEVDGSVTAGDQFVLGKEGNQAIFDRINLVPFKLTVSTSEIFEIDGKEGDDSLEVKALGGTGVKLVSFAGGEGNDSLNGSQTTTNLFAEGGVGNDTLTGGSGKDQLDGGDGIDVLTGGAGKDTFLFSSDPFANGTPILTPIGFQALAAPDILTDYKIGTDQLAFTQDALGVSSLEFQKGTAAGLSGASNLLVLLDGFANAAAAAQAIADNNAVTAGAGLFVYYNTTLGISRVVFSEDLGNAGSISVLENLTSITSVSDQAKFSAKDFALV